MITRSRIIRVWAQREARQIVLDRLKAKGFRPSAFEFAEITRMAEAYRAEGEAIALRKLAELERKH
jgi:hypothetical protein